MFPQAGQTPQGQGLQIGPLYNPGKGSLEQSRAFREGLTVRCDGGGERVEHVAKAVATATVLPLIHWANKYITAPFEPWCPAL